MLYPIQNSVRNKLDLSGIWDFKTDPEGVGEQNGWFNGLAESRPIAVPGSWNEQYEDLFNYLGLAWYVKRTYVPRSWQGQRVFIRVGSANYYGTVYVNGEQVGAHEGGHLPFAFEITNLVKWDDENVIAISVENELKPTRVPSGNMNSAIGAFASFPRTTFDFFPFAGIHRPVVLYTVPQTHIEDVTVVTGIDGATGTVTVTARLNAVGDGAGQRHAQWRRHAGAGRAVVQGRRGRGAAHRPQRPALVGQGPIPLRPDRANGKRPLHAQGWHPHDRGAGRPDSAQRPAGAAQRLRPPRGFHRQRQGLESAADGQGLPADALDRRQQLSHLALPVQRRGDAAGRPRGLPDHRRDPGRQPAVRY